MDSQDREGEILDVTSLPVQVANKIRCPICRRDDFESNGTHKGIRYYKCGVCCDPSTSMPTTFKVIMTDPLQAERYVEGMEQRMLPDEYSPVKLT